MSIENTMSLEYFRGMVELDTTEEVLAYLDSGEGKEEFMELYYYFRIGFPHAYIKQKLDTIKIRIES